ncbi:MAG TPA: hypothetical protein VFR64_10725 [Methylomirabilota bacterium]|nr:hypothetical protein [Methylomirabilota bacterium]
MTTALDELERRAVGPRIWKKEAALWSDVAPVQAAIAQRLGWLDAPAATRGHVGELSRFAAGLRAEGYTDAVLLGMGGSSLAAEVLAATFPPAGAGLALTMLDTTDPGAIRAARDGLDLARTIFVVSSKSGTTAEMLALYRFFRAELDAQVPNPGAHCIAITDPGTPLERLAADDRFRRTFLNAPDIGGRFSALSLFGLVPAALIGVEIGRLLDRAATMAAACGPGIAAADNPALRLGAALGGNARAGRDKVTLVLSPPIRALGAWLEQLLTESTGKQGRGLIVVNEEPLGTPEVYGGDRLFVALSLGPDPDLAGRLAALQAAGHPVVHLPLTDRVDVGGEFFRWELATAVAGVLLRSWLLELTADVLATDPELSAWVEDSGEGRWTVQDAVEKAVPAPAITAALFARFRSRRENSFADRLLAALRRAFGGHAVRR